MLLSALFPGLGQLFNREWKKSLIFFSVNTIIYIIGQIFIIPTITSSGMATIVETFRPDVMTFLLSSVIVWMFSVEDAWRSGMRRSGIHDKRKNQSFLRRNLSNLAFAISVIGIVIFITSLVMIYPHMSYDDGKLDFNFCPSNCNDHKMCTEDYCNASTEYMCVHMNITPCCGDGICDSHTEECDSCYTDCGWCIRDAYLEIKFWALSYANLEELSEDDFRLINRSRMATNIRSTISNRGDFDANITNVDFVCYSEGEFIENGETYNGVTFDFIGDDITKIEPGESNRATMWFKFKWLSEDIPSFTMTCDLTVGWDSDDANYVSKSFTINF